MPRLRLLLFLLFAPLVFGACQKKEEAPPPGKAKKAEPLPALTAERVDLWLLVASDLKEYVRKFSMDGEPVEDKRDLLMLAHSSARPQLAYGELFKSRGMSTREFWYILDEMEKVEKFVRIKGEEDDQRRRIDILVEAGRLELADLKGRIARTVSATEKERLEQAAAGMEAEIVRFEEMRRESAPEDFGISRDLMALWEAKWPEVEKGIGAVWKSDGGPGKKGAALPAGHP